MAAIDSPAKDLPLREDVRTLGALLGEVLREQGGEALFARVEAARLAARRRRVGEAGAEDELTGLLRGLAPPDAVEVTRAFSAYFGLVNMAERVHRIRRIRAYLAERTPVPGGLAAVLRGVAAEGVELATVRDALARLRVEPVFTAHPTEAVRRTLLMKEQRIARALVDRLERAPLTPDEDAGTLARIRTEVTAAWQTAEQPASGIAVADEVEHILFYLVEVIYRVVPAFYEHLEAALAAAYGPDAARALPPGLLRFASWVGGDADGNPNVGAATITATLARHRELILRRYQPELRSLFDHLSQARARVGVSAALEARLAAYRALLPAVWQRIPARYHDMPYRLLLEHVAARLAAAAHDGPGAYPDAASFLADLDLIGASLAAHRGAHAGLELVTRLRRRVETFGFHLATLDVRQHAGAHRRALAALLADPGFPALPAAARAARLRALLAAPPPPPAAGATDPDAAATLATMRAIGAARARHGAAAIGPYIISMAEGPDDVLAVLALARLAGLTGADDAVPLDVAPLLETTPDLARGRRILTELFDDPLYRRHLATRGGGQLVMLGYSDSNKEAGLAASRVALFDAEGDLTAAADAAGVGLTLFHGRGGTASRGGSKPREAVLAEPPHVVRGHVRVTEQGENIHAKYGLRGIAIRTLELMAGAVLEVTTCGGRCPSPAPAWVAAARTLAEDSAVVYRRLVFEDPDFLAYFRAATPIDVIELLRIGSRPSRRTGAGGIADLRAIPWVFAWTQSRHILPSWYGLGTGLERLRERHGPALLAEMAAGWPFFANLLADVEMVLAKADMPIAAHYAELAGPAGARLFPHLRAEFARTVALIVEARGAREILDGEPALKREIRLRNPYVDPMSLVQVDLLARWRAGDRRDDALREALFTTVRGIARGLQNTG
ncbi:MAG TPA: phosphoenolpyruvate carboxylase [Polyangia bacterium]|jgi:phosphoenolpyruvate carboxylase